MFGLHPSEWSWRLRSIVVLLATLSAAFGVLGGYGVLFTVTHSSTGLAVVKQSVVSDTEPESALPLATSPQSSTGSNTAGGSSVETSIPPASSATISYLRVLHAAGNTPAIKVLIDNVPAFGSLSFAHDTGYIQVASGGHTIQLVNAANPSTVYVRAPVSLQSALYTLALYGLQGAAFPVDRLHWKLFFDSATVSDGHARLRVVNLGVARPPLDIWVRRSSAAWARDYVDIAYAGASGYLNFSPAVFRFAVGNHPTVIVSRTFYTSGTTTLANVTVDTVWLIGGSAPRATGAAFRAYVTQDIKGTDGNG